MENVAPKTMYQGRDTSRSSKLGLPRPQGIDVSDSAELNSPNVPVGDVLFPYGMLAETQDGPTGVSGWQPEQDVPYCKLPRR